MIEDKKLRSNAWNGRGGAVCLAFGHSKLETRTDTFSSFRNQVFRRCVFVYAQGVLSWSAVM